MRSTPSLREADGSSSTPSAPGRPRSATSWTALELSQPQVSKHLAVLRTVGLVAVRAEGRHRWYRVNGVALQPVYEWIRGFESTWNNRLDQLDDVLVELQKEERQP